MTVGGLQAREALRPFYFIISVWGRRYIDYLCDYCLPSFLSPNNIPALRTRSSFLIATVEEDWAYLQSRPIFGLLKQYCDPVFLPIPPCPPDVSPCVHMGIGHKLATQMAFRDKAYGAVLTPDLMISDGTIAAMQKRAAEGYEVVITAALRFGEEPLFENLHRMGILTPGERLSETLRPLTASGRQLVHAGIRSFHSETLSYEWERPYFASYPSALWWKVPDGTGVVVHSLSWAPLLFDYGALEHHDSSVMDEWTIDGDYIHKNFGLRGKVYVVQDSDEVMHITWAPMADRELDLRPNPAYVGRHGEWEKGLVFNRALHSNIFDPLKREIVFKPVYWHETEIDKKSGPWKDTERRAQYVLRRYGTGDLFFKFLQMRSAARIFRDAMMRKYAVCDADGRSPSWVNMELAQTLPAYNHAANHWIQHRGNTGRLEDITPGVLKAMADYDPAWGKDYQRMRRWAGWALRPAILAARYYRAIRFRLGRLISA